MNGAITADTYVQRRGRLISQFDALGVDVFVVSNLKNVRYLSGFSGSHAVLVLAASGGTIVSDGRYQEQIASEVTGLEIEIQGDRRDLETVVDVLSAYTTASSCVGFESVHMPFARYESLSEMLGARTLVSCPGAIEQLRRIKDEGEIGLVRKALQIAEQSIEAACHELRSGMTEREFAHSIEHQMWLAGAEKESFESLVLFGERSSLPHGKPGKRALKPGDIVLMDIGCVVDGYCSDITRTCFYGKPPKDFLAAYDAVLKAQVSAVNGLRAGLTCKDADSFARDSLSAAGRGEQYIHSTGHGVGLDIHEAPRLSQSSTERLAAGELVTVEPGVYIEGWGGIRIEDMVVVRERGSERLNCLSTDLVSIDAS